MTKPNSPAASFTLAAPRTPFVDVERFRSDLREADIEEMVNTLLVTFLEDSPGRLTTLEHAVESRDVTAIQTAAHAFKSGAGTIRATHLAELLQAAEQSARAGQPTSPTFLDEVRAEYAGVRRQLEAALRDES